MNVSIVTIVRVGLIILLFMASIIFVLFCGSHYFGYPNPFPSKRPFKDRKR